jgi:hypothetical protein
MKKSEYVFDEGDTLVHNYRICISLCDDSYTFRFTKYIFMLKYLLKLEFRSPFLSLYIV